MILTSPFAISGESKFGVKATVNGEEMVCYNHDEAVNLVGTLSECVKYHELSAAPKFTYIKNGFGWSGILVGLAVGLGTGYLAFK